MQLCNFKSFIIVVIHGVFSGKLGPGAIFVTLKLL